ncbi:MAG TPA: aminotransferase class V-fold PLP-dependent enzyme [Bacteroidetes bacterium]|nr:aminotransferase class V-fold PLP-dependent enzyme [Bacteroidota bacterium]
MNELEKYFQQYRDNIVGIDAHYESPYGKQPLIYCDWIASGRLYEPLERKISGEFGRFVANTHTETSETGKRMTWAYHEAQKIIKRHVNAGPNDVLITAGSGMTTVINKFMRIMGLKSCQHTDLPCLKNIEKPVVFITHMEHHSNQTSWYETLTDVVVLPPGEDLLVDPGILKRELKKYEDRKFKIGSFTACSNVTGVSTPYYELAKTMHEHGGICLVDFAASAPYVDINMHPADPMQKLDAIFFSPHKFLGGPGSSGVLVFDSALYEREVPDNPGGGTVDWTNPWGEYKYVDDIEAREDGGTPGFIQAIRTALAIRLKEQMGTSRIKEREDQLVQRTFRELRSIKGLKLLADNVEERLPVFSFYIRDIHYNLVVKVLSDRYGIQTRGGCACAGTYGHYLLQVSYDKSHRITEKINSGDLSEKPGWIRMSLHPTMTDNELDYVISAIREITEKKEIWKKDYLYRKGSNEFIHKDESGISVEQVKSWFNMNS